MPRFFHWPGGIPTCIKPHPETNLSLDEVKEEVKGWLLFVQENWTSAENASVSFDGEFELNQRRQLVEKWASATQEFRDTYQSRAPVGLPGTEGPRKNGLDEGLRYPAESLERLLDTYQPVNTDSLISLVPVDETHPENRARWVKFAVLLYNYDIEVGHCLFGKDRLSEVNLNPETATYPSVENYLPWEYLETAHFGTIFLTRSGTVLYLGRLGPYMLVDEVGLKTGRLSIVMYEMNGTVDCVEVRPFNMRWPYLNGFINYHSFDNVKHCAGAYRHQNTPLDMDLPVVDILCQAKEANQLPESMALSDREQWTSDIELYAPGYLALEAEWRAGEYELSRLTDPRSIGITKEIMVKVRDPSFSHPGWSFIPLPQGQLR